ncbi:MAG: hypothetical protein K2G69_03865, partial [Muribaculaceae bacterium]|nr:hypothetical protein [Muribaculaceae bacterium]
MKKSSYFRFSIFIPSILIMLGMAAACNSDSYSDKQEVAVTSSTVAINSFYLKADAKVMKNLDSVFFSIDLN